MPDQGQWLKSPILVVEKPNRWAGVNSVQLIREEWSHRQNTCNGGSNRTDLFVIRFAFLHRFMFLHLLLPHLLKLGLLVGSEYGVDLVM